jgi:hypothetical protein
MTSSSCRPASNTRFQFGAVDLVFLVITSPVTDDEKPV